MTIQTISEWLIEHPEVGYVFAAVVDLNGVLRGKRMPAAAAAKLRNGGMRMPLSVAGVDVWGEDIEGSDLVFETGDADGLCEVTGRGPLPMPWMAKPTALCPVWFANEDGSPFLGDPRRALAAVVERFAVLGLTPVVATELEFYLFDPSGPCPRPPTSPLNGSCHDSNAVLSIDVLEHFDAVLSEIYDACAAQGIPADSAISENGAGQFEINMTHVADPLKAADDAIFFKKIVRGIARKHHLGATFMAKPYGDRAGNGFHVHFSLIDENGVNIFDDGTEAGAETLRNAVAGLIQNMRDCTLIWAPHANSYRRFAPGSHAPSAVSWAYENRTSAIRIPGGPPVARRIEHRVAGADANPYLVLSAILGGALIGLEQKLHPPEPITGDAYALDLPRLATDWASAIEAFDTGGGVNTIFSERLRGMLVDCKTQELRRFTSQVTDFEYATYLDVV